MLEKDMALGLPKTTQPKAVYNGCLLSKQVKKSFPSKAEFVAKGNLNWYMLIYVVRSLHQLQLEIGMYENSQVIVYTIQPLGARLHVTRDVVFEEDKRWNWEHSEMQGNNKSESFIIIDTQSKMYEEDETESRSPRTPSSGTSWAVQGNEGNGYDSDTAGDSSEPRNFRLLSEVYDETEEVDILEEILLLVVEELGTFEQARVSSVGFEYPKHNIYL